MAARASWILVCLTFAVAATCNDIQRIYQNRISLVDSQIVVRTYEVIGLASVELNLQPPPTYFFDCNTTANNGSGITWLGPLPPLFREESIPTSSNGKRLSVAGITSDDLGVYTCLDSYTNTTTSVHITMDNPAIIPINRVLRVMQGSNATLTVYVAGYPLVSSEHIQWFRPNGSEILPNDAVFDDERRSLVMINVQSSDAGMYACQITTSYGSSRTVIQLDVYGLNPLQTYQGRISVINSQVDLEVFPVQGLATIRFGEEAGITYYLDCNTSRNDGSGIQWLGIASDSSIQVTDAPNGNGKRLDLAGVRESELGQYECLDTATGDRAFVNITKDNPAVTPVNALVEVLRGDRAVLEVYASSYPPINGSQIRWYWPNGSEILEQDAEFMDGRRSLFLVDVQLSYTGLYRCDVTLPAPMATRSATIDLQVHVNSAILSDPRPLVRASEWTEVEIHCTASGSPIPNVTWEKVGGATPPTAVNTINYSQNRVTSVLTFDRVRYSDRGRYRCVADNSKTPIVNSTYAEIRVTPLLLIPSINISGEPQEFQNSITVAEGAEVEVECTGSGQLMWTVSGGEEIPTDENSTNLYQVYISSQETQVLHIRNFSSDTTAMTYVCRSRLTGRVVEISVTLSGDVEMISTTASEQKADSASAIVGGVMAGVIVAMLIAMFMLVILLIVVRGRLHEHAQVNASDFTPLSNHSIENGNGTLTLVSVKSLELQSDSGDGSTPAGSSIVEKVDQGSSSTPTCAEKINIEVL